MGHTFLLDKVNIKSHFILFTYLGNLSFGRQVSIDLYTGGGVVPSYSILVVSLPCPSALPTLVLHHWLLLLLVVLLLLYRPVPPVECIVYTTQPYIYTDNPDKMWCNDF